MNPVVALALAGAVALGACDQLRLEPQPAEPATPPVTTAAAPDLRPLAGETFQALIAAQERYTPANLGLADADAARLMRAMGAAAPAWIVTGGGVEAIVFSGCDADGCDEGRAVVAIDLASGAPFVAVRDREGAAELTAEDRVEALLRLNSPTRNWHDARPPRPRAPAQVRP